MSNRPVRIAAETRVRPVLFAAITTITATVAIAGCQSSQPAEPTVMTERDQVVRAFSPQWYRKTPRSDEGSIYKTAQAVGANPSVSENLAVNQARQEMALSIDSRVDVLQRSFQEQIEAADNLDLLQRFQDVNTIVSSKTLHGSHVVRKETYVEPDGTYRTFVLMELDWRELASNYLGQLESIDALETRLRSSEAWAELERRARELRDEELRSGLPPMTDEAVRGTLDG